MDLGFLDCFGRVKPCHIMDLNFGDYFRRENPVFY